MNKDNPIPSLLTAQAMNVLPLSLKLTARDAYKRDAHPLTVERALKYLDGDPPMARAVGLLPVCFVHLESTNLPSVDDFKTLDLPIAKRISRATSAVAGVFQIDFDDVPGGAETACYLFPRVFAWYGFMVDHWAHFHGDALEPKLEFTLEFIRFVLVCSDEAQLPRQLLDTPRFLEHIIRIWAIYPALADAVDDADALLPGLDCIMLCLQITSEDRFKQLVAGAGGSIADVARLIDSALNTLVDTGKQHSSPTDPLQRERSSVRVTLFGSFLLLLLGAHNFAASPRHSRGSPWLGYDWGELFEELLERNFIPTLMSVALDAASPGDEARFSPDDGWSRLNVIHYCLYILVCFISNNHGDCCGWIDDALEHGLFDLIIYAEALVGGLDHSESDELDGAAEKFAMVVNILLGQVLPIELLTRSNLLPAYDRLLALPSRHHNLSTGEPLKISTLRPMWASFISLVRERIAITEEEESYRHTVCDNPDCRRNSSADIVLRRCSGCQATYYCSKECQRADWRRTDGHREYCIFYRNGTLVLAGCAKDRFPYRERLYTRALLNNDYHKRWIAIYTLHVELMVKYPTEFGLASTDLPGYRPINVFFNYTRHPGSIRVFSTLPQDCVPGGIHRILSDDGPEWEDLMARATLSGGRLQLHVLQVFDGEDIRYVAVPLRLDEGAGAFCAALVDVARRVFGRMQGKDEAEVKSMIEQEVEVLQMSFKEMKQIHC
ncbi:hypothetical protein MIND_00910200 [Mycena indigotica]|uniref:phytol kinase n=1 Tax=Mycena indigotica TaxID=2126181 RepID=A0A8H6VWU4_9AGAR|nr:uncharacterized protein MIND_00910200 [Mycena indigotica]KAF7296792.1 hypothetical protein MIND_00910200 [Mycena indigotica]